MPIKRVSLDFRTTKNAEKKYTSVDVARVKSEVKRYNTNLRYLAEKYGIDSVVYKDRVGSLMGKSGLDEKWWHLNKDGVFQLKETGEYLYTQSGRSSLLQTRQKSVSVKTIERQVRLELQESGNAPKVNASKSEKQQFEQIVKAQVERGIGINNRLENVKDFLYKSDETREHENVRKNVPELYTQGKKTYEELEAIVDKMETQRDKELEKWEKEENPPDFVIRALQSRR